MSTKTTFKRVALVAVAALGMGVLTSVAPASAAVVGTAISAAATGPSRVGISTLIKVTSTVPKATVDGADLTVSAKATTKPTGSTQLDMITFVAGTSADHSATGSTKGASLSGAATASTATAAATATVNADGTANTRTKNVYYVSFTPDVAGTYTLLISEGSATYTSGDKATSVTITTTGAPTSITVTKINGTVVDNAAAGYAGLLAVTLKDANGNATKLGTDESIAWDSSSALITDSSFGTATGADPANYVDGAYLVRLADNGTVADGSTVITFTGDGVLNSSLTSAVTVTLLAAKSTATADITSIELTDAEGYDATNVQAVLTSGLSSHAFTVTAAAADTATARVYPVNVQLTSGITYTTSVEIAKGETTGEVSVDSAITSADLRALSVSVGAVAVNARTITVAYAASSETGGTLKLLYPTTAILSATGATNTFTVELKDQYGDAISNTGILATVSGRNTVSSKAIGATDADGRLTYSLKDIGTSGTTDSVSFATTTGAATSTASATVTYGTVTVAKVSFTGGSTTKSVANATVTTNAIEADDTPESAQVTATVTLTDANGALLAGVPVVFTVSGTGAAITSTKTTVYSTSAGVAVGHVYAWLAGTYTVTATAGGVSSTGSYTFANSRPADARVLSAKVEGGLVTATVVDRFGNPVSGVSVYATKTGSGYFGAGLTKTSGTTGTDGTVDFAFVGSGDVTVKTLNYADPAGTNASGQTCALAGNLTCASGATAAKAFTATTAGTILKDEKNVGSSYAPAGVSSASVSVSNDASSAAADAAAEATDAANAATDAANAAAEAADAATAAAQDAADAVAALSAQVATLISGLKSQLTALTNLVIKIQKKVKA